MKPGFMTSNALLRAIDPKRVEDAIREAERRTSGEIRVSISRFFWGDVAHVADRTFTRLGMTNTKDRNGILFFLVPSRRRFVILGDEGIHARVGQEFWDEVAAAVSGQLREGNFTRGLVWGIEAVGEQLAKHFPYEAETDKNELPDAIDFGE